jgi:hypothetical protein
VLAQRAVLGFERARHGCMCYAFLSERMMYRHNAICFLPLQKVSFMWL